MGLRESSGGAEATVSFHRFVGETANQLHAKLNGDATEEKLLAVVEHLEHGDVTEKDRQVAQRIGVELHDLSQRCRYYIRRLEREVAKWPEPERQAYVAEMERLRQ
jgi:hypothetical protein